MKSQLQFILFFLLASACRAEIEPEIIATTRNGNPIYNLVQNGNFEDWDSPFKPAGWEIGETSNLHIFHQSDRSREGNWALYIKSNLQGSHYVHQIVEVEPKSFYQSSVLVSGDIHDWHYGGLTIKAPDGSRVMARHKIAMKSLSNYEKELSTKFFSANLTSVQVSLGFEDGVNATVWFDALKIRKVENAILAPREQQLIAVFGLDEFDSVNYHNNVLSLCATLNSQLKKSMAKKIEFGDSIKPLLKDSSWFHRFFSQPTESGFCQQASLSASYLMLQFKIPTRHIHFQKEGVGFHQFIEYWHPYQGKWIIADPYYGIGYHQDQELIGYNELVKLKERGITEADLILLDINRAEYNLEILQIGWDSEWMRQSYDDDRITFAH